MKQYIITDQGKVRKQNEDAVGLYENKSKQVLSVIADGMGGHRAGDVASEIAKTTLQEEWKENEGIQTSEEGEAWLDDKIRLANRLVYQHAEANPECKGMGTTVIAAIILDDQISIAHIGDSRCYLLADEFKQITEDHSLVNELVKTGEITKKEANIHPRKNFLVKALGTNESIAPDIFTIKWESGNRLLICTDGLSDKVSDLELKDYLKQESTLEEIGKQLVDRANELGGEDNITLALLENTADEEGESSC